MKSRELRQKRAGLVAQARTLLEKAEAEKRELTQEEENQYNALMADVNKIGAEVERLEKLEELEDDLRGSVTEPMRSDVAGGGENRSLRGRETEEYRSAYQSYLRGGLNTMRNEEIRALQADNETLGGALVAPVQMRNSLIQAVDDMVYIRQWATVLSVEGAQSLGAASLDADPEDGDWTSEIKQVDEDTAMSFGKRELVPNMLSKLIKISLKLINRVPSAETLVNGRLAYKFGVTKEKAYLTGNGVKRPLGVFTPSDDGVPTSRDVSTGNTSTQIKADNLINVKYSLKPQYWKKAKWLFHRDAVKQIAQLKDGEGQYLWRESIRVGEPDMLLSLPLFMSEYAPNTFTTGLYVGILGDFSYYWIADGMTMTIQRLVELYAATNQVGLIGRLESDGMPVLAEAFARVKLA